MIVTVSLIQNREEIYKNLPYQFFELIYLGEKETTEK